MVIHFVHISDIVDIVDIVDIADIVDIVDIVDHPRLNCLFTTVNSEPFSLYLIYYTTKMIMKKTV